MELVVCLEHERSVVRVAMCSVGEYQVGKTVDEGMQASMKRCRWYDTEGCYMRLLSGTSREVLDVVCVKARHRSAHPIVVFEFSVFVDSDELLFNRV